MHESPATPELFGGGAGVDFCACVSALISLLAEKNTGTIFHIRGVGVRNFGGLGELCANNLKMKQLKSHVRHDDPEIMSISHIHVLLLFCAISFVSLTLPSRSPWSPYRGTGGDDVAGTFLLNPGLD